MKLAYPRHNEEKLDVKVLIAEGWQVFRVSPPPVSSSMHMLIICIDDYGSPYIQQAYWKPHDSYDAGSVVTMLTIEGSAIPEPYENITHQVVFWKPIVSLLKYEADRNKKMEE